MELLDNVKILLRNIIVVLFHLTEGSLMVHHEVVDVLVLSLLDLVNLDLHAQLQLLLQVLQLLLVHGDESLLVLLKTVLENLKI